MADKATRDSFMYIFGLLVVLGLIVFVISQLGSLGLLFWGNPAEKTYAKAPDKVIVDGKSYQALIKTSLGDIKVELFANNAPTTVNNFVFLSRDKFYDGVQFHRIVRDFIAQTGSRLSLDKNPQNDGVGGPGYRFEDEMNWDSLGLSNSQRESLQTSGYASSSKVKSVLMDKYYLAMANAGPNTNGSQFFFTLADKSSESIASLQGRHTTFGKVIEGTAVLDAMNKVELADEQTSSPRPITPITINSIEIIEQ